MTTLPIVNKILSIYGIKNPLITKQLKDFGVLFKDFQDNNNFFVFKFADQASATLSIFYQAKNEAETPNSVHLIGKILDVNKIF